MNTLNLQTPKSLLGRSRLLLASLLAAGLAAAPPDLGPGHTLTPKAQWTDELGQTHIRYEHRYMGLRVWGSELVEHLGPGAAPPTSGLAVASPSSPAFQAFLTAQPAAGEAILWPEFLQVPADDGSDAEQMDQDLLDYRNALYYPAQTDPDNPEEDAWDFVVDAATGDVLAQIPVNLSLTAEKGTGNSFYSGTVTLDTTSAGTGFLLQDLTRGKGGTFGYNQIVNGGALPLSTYGSSTNVWGNGVGEAPGENPSSLTGQTMAVDMAFALQTSWDYFRTIHNRLGVDGTGTAIRGLAHTLTTSGGDNAEWLGGQNSFCVYTPVSLLPLSSLMVLGHELAHGVTEKTANLVYSGEPGGLNEATSDIFGAMIDTWYRNGSGATIGNTGTDWMLTFYANIPGLGKVPKVARNFIKPSSAPRPSPDAWSPTLYQIDVHNSSGPMNRAFYFLSQGSSPDPDSPSYSPQLPAGMAGVGNDEAARIWYRALTTYLTPASNYASARNAALQAAGDLFGSNSPETSAVASAFAGIKVGTPGTRTPPGSTPFPATAASSGTMLTLTATPPGPVTKVVFYVDGIYVGSAATSPYALTLDAGRTLANGSHTLVAKAFNGSGQTGASQAVNFTLANPYQQILPDPGFEGGGRGWTGPDLASVLSFDPTGAAPRSGFRWLQFGDTTGKALETVATTFTVPAGSTYAALKFWVRVDAAAPGSQDLLAVGLQTKPATGPLGPTFATLTVSPASTPEEVWVQQSQDLSAYAGQTILLAMVAGYTTHNTKFAVDDVTLVCSSTGPPVAVTLNPASLEVWPGTTASTAFTATVTGATDQTVTWSSAGGGSIDATGVYTPPAAPGTATVKAVSAADPTASATANVLVKPYVALTPASATLDTGSTLALTLAAAPGVSPVLTLTGGPTPGTYQNTNPGQILYTAPPVPGTYVLQVQDPASGATASATLEVVGVPILVTITPASAFLSVSAGLKFTATVQGDASASVAWSIQEAGGGSIDATGLYAAPSAAGTYHVLATSVLDPTKTAGATVSVVTGLALSPPQSTVLTGAAQGFTVSVPGHGAQAVNWSILEGAAGGTVQGGAYTAPATPGTYHVLAASAADATLTAQAAVTVKTTDLDGDGVVTLDFGDLAVLADAWGVLPVVGLADLNGDGVVDDQDVALFFSRFGGLP